VRQLVSDFEDLEEVNKQLDQMCAAAQALQQRLAQRLTQPCVAAPRLRLETAQFPGGAPARPPCERGAEAPGPLPRRGYNIGIRLIDEFLAKAKIGR
jgi:hypothetical protein